MYNLPKGYLSANQINKYLMCPRDYYFAYIENKPYKIKDTLVIGRMVSALMHGYNKLKKEQQQLETWEHNEWLKELAKYSQVDLDFVTECKNVALQCVNGYIEYAKEKGADSYIVVEAEEKRMFTVDNIDIVVIPDLIKSDIATLEDVIVDYKTAKNTKYNTDMLKYDTQTSIYAICTGIYNVEIHEIVKPKVLKKETRSAICNIVPCQKTQDSIDDIVEVINDTAKCISAGLFPKCDPGYWKCSESWCDYWEMCRGK